MVRLTDRAFRVYYVDVPEVGKEKYVVAVAPYGSQWYCFLINSDLPLFLQQLTACHFIVPRAQHPFLSYDSYLTTNRAFPLHTDTLNCHVGNLHSSCQEKLYEAIRDCPSLGRETKHLMVEYLSSHAQHCCTE